MAKLALLQRLQDTAPRPSTESCSTTKQARYLRRTLSPGTSTIRRKRHLASAPMTTAHPCNVRPTEQSYLQRTLKETSGTATRIPALSRALRLPSPCMHAVVARRVEAPTARSYTVVIYMTR